jgi:5-methyltetrahydrofolate--homocysteine methyltransferase
LKKPRGCLQKAKVKTMGRGGSSDLRSVLGTRVLLLDGGLGSVLISKGLAAGNAPETWVLEHPDSLVEVHREYANAGADIVHTVTFGGSPPKLASVGLQDQCRALNRRAVELAQEAGDVWIAGDVGPTGWMLPPMGTATPETLYAAFEEQITALAEAGVDLISIETMFDLREALQAVRAAVATGLPVFASLTFDIKKRGVFTIMGDRLIASMQSLADAGADVVGFNCTLDSSAMSSLVAEASAACPRPLVVQPNAGQPRVTSEGIVYDVSPEDFVSDMMSIVDAGAGVVGGCCGTDPSFIRALRKALDERD